MGCAGGRAARRARLAARPTASPDHERPEPDQGEREPPDPDALQEGVGRVPEVVGDESDARCPADSAERVPDYERAPGHVIDAGEPRRGDPEPREPAAEEDRLAAVALKHPLPGLERASAVVLE